MDLHLAVSFLAFCIIFTKGQSSELDDIYMHPYTKFHLRTDEREYERSQFWWQNAQDVLGDKLKEQKIEKEAKNIIMFLGDGWGVTTLTPTRILKGQKVDNVKFGEEGILHVDTFPHSGFSKTFCTDSQVADSACSATAYLCGVKANIATIGVTADVQRRNCTAQMLNENHVSSILAWAQAAGKSTGIVTTARVTHASPSGAYAHIADRDWEADTDIVDAEGGTGTDTDICDDIAEQLVLKEPGKNINVILGGGRRKFFPKGHRDSEDDEGTREDGKDLVNEWRRSKSQAENAVYTESASALKEIDPSTTDYLMGLFAAGHIAYYHEQEENDDPSLTDMTEKAIQILSRNPKGYFLFVEGGRIDHAHHGNRGMRALWEAVEFDRAIKKGDDMTDDDNTLIVVTADHSHVFSFAGYPARGNELWEYAGEGEDDMKYATLNYANGPGFKKFKDEKRHNIEDDDKEDLRYRQVPMVPLASETHGGEDVGIFAKGPFAHLLTGVQQQSYIPHVMAYASCVGSGLTYCDNFKK